MITLASFPRSGNTFFRNVLYEVYGIESSTYHLDPDRVLDENYLDFKVAKTHLRPQKLPPELQARPAVYLIRDGRDALVSIAHHRKDIVAPGTDFYNNLLEAILAQHGSFFGGWAQNVREWTAKAAIVIRFEDLIEDPIREVEKLREIMDLPPADPSKLPTFKDLKFGSPQYGAKSGEGIDSDIRQKNFRRGKVGGWKDELPPELEKLLWNIHGAELLRWGYEPSLFTPAHTPKRVLVECSKLYSHDNDGVTRYMAELVKGLTILLPHLPEWNVELYDRKSIQPLAAKSSPEIAEAMAEAAEFKQITPRKRILEDLRTASYEKILLLLKERIKKWMPAQFYEFFAEYYRRGPFRSGLSRLRLVVRRWRYYRSESHIFAELAKCDLIHLPLPQHFTELADEKTPLLATVHDLTHKLFPQYHSSENIDFAEQGMQAVLERNAHLLAVSESTRQDVKASYQLPDNRVHLVHEAANFGHFRPKDRDQNTSKLRKRYNVPDTPYLMCLSVIEPRKNLQNTIRAFLQLKAEQPELSTKLVICGKHGWKIKEVFAGIDLDHPDLVFTGFVNDVDLPYLYAHARALCYISFYEGFGLPILESLACKTPVIYGNNSSLPEVAGPGGWPVDAHDIESIKAAMLRAITNEEEWKERAELGWQHANKFSWLKTALQTLEVYDKVIKA